MLFNSSLFIFVFLPVCLTGFYFFKKQTNKTWVLWLNLCSIVFYGYWSLTHLSILILSVTLNYFLARSMRRFGKLALAMGIIFNLSLLGYFKYSNFLIEQINFGFGTNLDLIKIVLPIGISFFTFQQIAYLADLYKRKAETASYNRYLFFISFFPQLIAGPIVHHEEIFKQLKKRRHFLKGLAIGFSFFCIGLFKKVVIADHVALTANEVFGYAEAGGAPTFLEAWYGALAYTLQIYFDFSAYSDMAIGLAYMFGLRLPQNFSSPYKATSIVDFWRRWHITLSRFLKDYLYIPLGGNRKGHIRKYINVIITMLIGGFWHGASWNFVLWGGLHGVFLFINQWSNDTFKVKSPKIVGWSLTFLLVVFAWVPFRATNIEGFLGIWKGMIFMNGVTLPESMSILNLSKGTLLPSVNTDMGLTIAVLLLICYFLPNTSEIFRKHNVTLSTKGYSHTMDKSKYINWRPTFLWSMLIVFMFTISILKLNNPSDFLYFQF